MDTHAVTQKLKAKANELGFTLVGVTSPDPPPHMEILRDWLAAGRHGEMKYLATERSLERRADPRRVLTGCKSILVLGIPYDKPMDLRKSENAAGRIAAYAWGQDYHLALKPKLESLIDYLEGLVGHPVANFWYTDTGPILERELAQRAGLGWIGKNTMLINPKHGSYFLLAEILLGIELNFDTALTTDHCGSCRRCIEACPTHCILENRTLDAANCISYLTIEFEGTIPGDLRPKMGTWVFGCDICQIACPWNDRFAEEKGDPAFFPIQSVGMPEEDLQLSREEFNRRFKSSPIKRAKRRGYLRNLVIALGNSHSATGVTPLARMLREEAEPLVRGLASWALGQIGGVTARAALQKASREESDSSVLGEIRSALSD